MKVNYNTNFTYKLCYINNKQIMLTTCSLIREMNQLTKIARLDQELAKYRNQMKMREGGTALKFEIDELAQLFILS